MRPTFLLLTILVVDPSSLVMVIGYSRCCSRAFSIPFFKKKIVSIFSSCFPIRSLINSCCLTIKKIVPVFYSCFPIRYLIISCYLFIVVGKMVLVAVFCPFLTVISVGILLCSNMKDKKKHVRENINLHPAHAQLPATSYNTNVTVTSKAQAAVRATLLNTLPDMTPPLENSDLMASTVNNHNSDTGALQKDESYLGFQASNLTKRFLQLQQGNVPLSDAEFHYSTGPDNLNVTAVPTFSDTSNHISNAPANCPDLPVIPAASQHFTNLQQKTTAGHKYLPFRLSSHVGQ